MCGSKAGSRVENTAAAVCAATNQLRSKGEATLRTVAPLCNCSITILLAQHICVQLLVSAVDVNCWVQVQHAASLSNLHMLGVHGLVNCLMDSQLQRIICRG